MSTYIHGTHPEEQERLSLLNTLINDRCISLLDITTGERIIDFGSGLGQFTMRMGILTGPGGYCLGIEQDSAQLAKARKNLADSGLTQVDYRQGNVEDISLGDEEGSFDLAHARFILEHVNHPEKVVQAMRQAVKPGGKVLLLDDDHDTMRLFPEPAGFKRLWTAYMQSYEALGNDPVVGRKLVSLLHHAGLSRIQNGVVFFGDCAGMKTFQVYANNLLGILEGSRDLMLNKNLIAQNEYTAGIKGIEEWSTLPDAALWYSINWASGERI
ncbi:MAG: methyltransferase domain-containing protein [Bacteroidetes bacterium]|nr:methyltransferase domain-containing protein [Bacteroidota bacterium]MBS1979258.1 methyltransferase domain-containing protein [Bacteroidota bacterium]